MTDITDIQELQQLLPEMGAMLSRALARAASIQVVVTADPAAGGKDPQAKARRARICQQVFASAWQGDINDLPSPALLEQALMLMLTIASVMRDEYTLQPLAAIEDKFVHECEVELEEALQSDKRVVKLGEEAGDSLYYILQGGFVLLLQQQASVLPWMEERLSMLLAKVRPYHVTFRMLLEALVAKMRRRSIIPKTEESLRAEHEDIAMVWGIDAAAMLAQPRFLEKVINLQREYKEKRESVPGTYASDFGNVVSHDDVATSQVTAYRNIISILGRYRSTVPSSHLSEEQVVARLQELAAEGDATEQTIYQEVLKALED